MLGDVLIGYNFAPLVFRDNETGSFEVDLSLCHDVREQKGGGCEDLNVPSRSLMRAQSNICITKSKDGDFLDLMESQPDSQFSASQISGHSSVLGRSNGNGNSM